MKNILGEEVTAPAPQSKVEPYRFDEGCLYEYNADSNAYILCFRNDLVKTKETAIKMYEKKEEEKWTAFY